MSYDFYPYVKFLKYLAVMKTRECKFYGFYNKILALNEILAGYCIRFFKALKIIYIKLLKLFAFAKIIGDLIEMLNSLSTISLDHCALRLTFIVVGVSLTRPLYCSLSWLAIIARGGF